MEACQRSAHPKTLHRIKSNQNFIYATANTIKRHQNFIYTTPKTTESQPKCLRRDKTMCIKKGIKTGSFKIKSMNNENKRHKRDEI